MKWLIFLQCLFFSNFVFAEQKIIFKITTDQARLYGIDSYTIIEETSEKNLSKYTLTSKTAGVEFTIQDSSVNGSRQLKKALQNSLALNPEVQSLLFRLGSSLAKAQSLDEHMKSRIDDFDVEIQRIQKRAQSLNGSIPSSIYNQILEINESINSKKFSDNKIELLKNYEFILRLSLSQTSNKDLNGIFEVEDLISSIQRTLMSLEVMISDLKKEQTELIEFSTEVESNSLVSQQLKMRNVTLYLRSQAQTLHYHINQTQQRKTTALEIQSILPKLDTNIIKRVQQLKHFAYEIRQSILNAKNELNDIDEKYDVFYGITGEMITSNHYKQISSAFNIIDTENSLQFCENRLCHPISLYKLEKNSNFSYAISNKHHLIIHNGKLDAIILTQRQLADIAKTLQCSSGAEKFSVGANSALQALQVAGWMIVGGVSDSIANVYRLSQSEPTNYDFTKRKMIENAKEYEASDIAYKNMQARRLSVLNEFINSFQAPLEELATNSIWSDSLIHLSTKKCENP